MSNNKNNILIIKHGAFGDIIQCDGVLHDIRKHYPQANITLLTTPAFKALMQRCPYIDDIITENRAPFWKINQQLNLIRSLNKKQYSTVIDLQNSSRTKKYRKFFFKNTPWIGRELPLTESSGLKGLLAQLTQAGIATDFTLSPKVTWMADNITPLLQQNNINSPYIALIPGCSARHLHKRWPYYTQLANVLIEQGYVVVNIIGPEELDLVKTIPGHTLLSKEKPMLSYFEMAGVLNQSCFIIGNDTGPCHVASCLDKPGLALFGPQTSAARTEISRGLFQAIEVKNLADLSVETVLENVLPKLPIRIK